MKRFIIWGCFLLFVSLTIAAEARNYRKETFDLYINGHMDKWQQVINAMRSEPNQTEAYQLEILGYYYGLIGHLMDIKQKDEAEKCLKQANDLADKLYKKNPNSPELLALMSNFTGFQIALTPVKAPFLYRGMSSNSKKAIQSGANNPVVNILYANLLFYMPEMFGGDHKKALAHYETALKQMEKSPQLTKNNWLYIQLLTTIGLVYEKMENYTQAQKMFQKVLHLQPGYPTVKNVIYPRLMTKMKV